MMVEFSVRPDDDEKFYSISDVAKKYGVSEVTVNKWLKKKEMVGFKFGRKWRIPESSVISFIQKSTST